MVEPDGWRRRVEEFVLGEVGAPPARVLEVGCGEGELARTLARAGHSVTTTLTSGSASSSLGTSFHSLTRLISWATFSCLAHGIVFQETVVSRFKTPLLASVKALAEGSSLSRSTSPLSAAPDLPGSSNRNSTLAFVLPSLSENLGMSPGMSRRRSLKPARYSTRASIILLLRFWGGAGNLGTFLILLRLARSHRSSACRSGPGGCRRQDGPRRGHRNGEGKYPMLPFTLSPDFPYSRRGDRTRCFTAVRAGAGRLALRIRRIELAPRELGLCEAYGRLLPARPNSPLSRCLCGTRAYGPDRTKPKSLHLTSVVDCWPYVGGARYARRCHGDTLRESVASE
jgi:hypothetical protein